MKKTPFRGFYGATAIYVLALIAIVSNMIRQQDYSWINFAVAGFFTILYFVIWISQKT